MPHHLETQVCIVGAGPAGAMLGMLLARDGINVVLIEKSNTSQREFRGESISPDSVAILYNLGIMPYIEKHGYLKTQRMQIIENKKCLLDVDFNRFNYQHKFTIDIPQPVLISALLTEAMKHSNFTLLRGTQCNSLITENEQVLGLICKRDDEIFQINSQLLVGADGRYGKIRKLANLSSVVSPLTRDVLWFTVQKPNNWGDIARLCIDKGHHIIVLPTYPNMLRIGFNIPSGEYKTIRQRPITYLHNIIERLVPSLYINVKEEITSWAKTTLLDIFTMEVNQWTKDGLILIGDAAHTLSPVLGQGVNQAILDSVGLAPILKKYFTPHQSQIFPAQRLIDFVNARKKIKAFVHKFQVNQEKILSLQTPLMTMMRRISYRFMNHSHFMQNKLWGQLLYKYQQEQNI